MKRLLVLALVIATMPGSADAQQTETVEYYGRDGIGSIRIVWDANGNMVGRKDYAPFGRPLSTVAAMPREGFGAQENDDETDQGFFHARMYQTRTGRFSAPDPVILGVSNPQRWNRYAYALNNPITTVDFDGLSARNSALCTTDIKEINANDWHCQSDSSTSTPLFQGVASGTQGAARDEHRDRTRTTRNPGGTGGGGGGNGGGDGGKDGDDEGGGDVDDPPKTQDCRGVARILKGNAATIGKRNGFSGDTVGNFPVAADGAAVIARQWTSLGKAALRPFVDWIWGQFNGGSFDGITDIVGGKPPRGSAPGTNVQDALMNLNPDTLIIELPGASQDFGVTEIKVTVPVALGCPAGTSIVK